jgi:hypothetical protein
MERKQERKSNRDESECSSERQLPKKRSMAFPTSSSSDNESRTDLTREKSEKQIKNEGTLNFRDS